MKRIHPLEYENLLARCREVAKSITWEGHLPPWEEPNPWHYPTQDICLPDGEAKIFLDWYHSWHRNGTWTQRITVQVRGKSHWMLYDSLGGVQSIGVDAPDGGIEWVTDNIRDWVMTTQELALQRPVR
jgi:hypothetical protein